MTRKLFILLTLFLVTIPIFAEAADTAWVRRYNGPGNGGEDAFAIALDGSGNVYVTGDSYGGLTNNYDYASIKYDSLGNELWIKRYNGPGSSTDCAYSMVVDNSGNVYVTGASIGIGTSYDYASIKYYPNGDTAWVRRYNGSGNGWDRARAIAVDEEGNVYVTGKSVESGTGDDYTTIKYDSSGNELWVKRYNGSGDDHDEAFAITLDGSGNICITGESYGSGTDKDFVTIKYYPNGDTAWIRRYNGSANGEDVAVAITVDNSDCIYVTGRSVDNATGQDYATIKYYPNGDTAWLRRYDSPEDRDSRASDIVVDGSGNVYITGISRKIETLFDYDYVTVKYAPDGTELWVERFDGGYGADGATAIALDDLGNVYVTGSAHALYAYWSDYTTIKYDPDGNELWVEWYDREGDSDDAVAIAVDGSGNVYVTGSSYTDSTGGDYATIKYIQTSSGIAESDYEIIPSEFSLCQNYPNPFNQSTKIEFTLKRSGFVNLNIYNILGRRVRSLISQDLSVGHKSVFWDGKDDSGEDVASGFYFYRLKSKDFSQTKKILLLK